MARPKKITNHGKNAVYVSKNGYAKTKQGTSEVTILEEGESMDLHEIAAASASKVAASRAEVKRGRGRPAGSKKVMDAPPILEPQGKIEGLNGISQSAPPSQFVENRAEMAKNYANGVVKPMYSFLADATGCKALECDDESAKAQGAAIADLSALYAPDLNPRSAAWLGVGIAVGGAAFAKWLTYKAWLAVEQKKAALDAGPDKNAQ